MEPSMCHSSPARGSVNQCLTGQESNWIACCSGSFQEAVAGHGAGELSSGNLHSTVKSLKRHKNRAPSSSCSFFRVLKYKSSYSDLPFTPLPFPQVKSIISCVPRNFNESLGLRPGCPHGTLPDPNPSFEMSSNIF
jgi:hypothetical protein